MDVYISAKSGSTEPTQATLLLLPDGFGLAQHNFILADNFAVEGFSVVMPDYFEGKNDGYNTRSTHWQLIDPNTR